MFHALFFPTFDRGFIHFSALVVQDLLPLNHLIQDPTSEEEEVI